MLNFITFLSLSICILGVWMFIRGRFPKRVGTTPRCAGCGYVLIGNTSGTCSECGKLLRYESITRGERHPRYLIAVPGAGLALIGLLLAIAAGAGQLKAIDWYEYRPFGWVLTDLADPTPKGASIRAFNELQRRDKAGTLSNAQVTRWVDQMINDLGTPAHSHLDEEYVDLQQRAIGNKFSASQRSAWAMQIIRDCDSNYFARHEFLRLWHGNLLNSAERSSAVQKIVAGVASNGDFELANLAGTMLINGELTAAQQKQFLDAFYIADISFEPPVLKPWGEPRFTLRFMEMGSHLPPGWAGHVIMHDLTVDGRPEKCKWVNQEATTPAGGVLPNQRLGVHHVALKITLTITSTATPGTPSITACTEEREAKADFEMKGG